MGSKNTVRSLIEALQGLEQEVGGEVSVLDEPRLLRRIVNTLKPLRMTLSEPVPFSRGYATISPERAIYLCRQMIHETDLLPCQIFLQKAVF